MQKETGNELCETSTKGRMPREVFVQSNREEPAGKVQRGEKVCLENRNGVLRSMRKDVVESATFPPENLGCL